MSALPEAYAAAAELEQKLGDPGQDANLLSFRQTMRLDEQEAFPEAALACLHRLGVHRIFVPGALGGDFVSSEGFLAVARVLARRDMTLTVSYCTMLWATWVWIGGTAEQKRRVAGWMLQSGHFPCLAHSEERHGADLVSNSLRAHAGADGRIRVTGEKWPVNRAARSEFVILLARTDAGVHMRNHSLFVVDKASLDVANYGHLPRVPTHGLRGCDISGIRFDDCALPADSLVGQPGHGLELALKGFQVTRTFCSSLSLGACDTALRIVAEFVCERRLYGQSAFDLPHVRDVLGNCYLSHIVSECISIVAARGLHLHTEQFAVWSPVVKVQVARLCDHSLAQLGQLFGSRHFLREGPAHGMFQKILRDSSIFSVFDGSSAVCLSALAAFLPSLAKGTEVPLSDVDVQRLFNLALPAPSLDLDRLSLSSRGRDAVVQSLPALRRDLEKLRDAATGTREEGDLERLASSAAALAKAWATLWADTARVFASPSGRHSAKAFALGERYCALHGAVACLGLWIHNRSRLSGFFASSRWIGAALRRQADVCFKVGELDPADATELCMQLRQQLQQNAMFSILHWPLAGQGTREQGRRPHPLEHDNHHHRGFHEPFIH